MGSEEGQSWLGRVLMLCLCRVAWAWCALYFTTVTLTWGEGAGAVQKLEGGEAGAGTGPLRNQFTAQKRVGQIDSRSF